MRPRRSEYAAAALLFPWGPYGGHAGNCMSTDTMGCAVHGEDRGGRAAAAAPWRGLLRTQTGSRRAVLATTRHCWGAGRMVSLQRAGNGICACARKRRPRQRSFCLTGSQRALLHNSGLSQQLLVVFCCSPVHGRSVLRVLQAGGLPCSALQAGALSVDHFRPQRSAASQCATGPRNLLESDARRTLHDHRLPLQAPGRL